MPNCYIICTTNDLVNDQRVLRMAGFLDRKGYEVELWGRETGNSPSASFIPYRTHRMKMVFKKGFLFYAFYNLRLFFRLMFLNKKPGLIAVDLDTLGACYLAGKLRNFPLIYDSHELFTEVPELQGRRCVQAVWSIAERLILPQVSHAITVNNSIAEEYRKKYGTDFKVIRNVPSLHSETEDFILPEEYMNMHRVLYQGAVNMGRGIEQLMDVVSGLENTVLIVAGEGDLYSSLKARSELDPYRGKVWFTGKLKPAVLKTLTSCCHLGVSVEQNLGRSYFLSLPNKLFDYIHAGIPVLVSDFPEMKAVVMKYQCGEVLAPGDAGLLATMIRYMLTDMDKRIFWTENALKAKQELNWEKEQLVLEDVINKLG